MTICFLSGSRNIRAIPSVVKSQVEAMVREGNSILVGDANGADKAMQGYLAQLECADVKVFHVGDQPRNNVGHWQECPIDGGKLRGRKLFMVKDQAMAERADRGLVVWDGISPGSLQNVLSLHKMGKVVDVYLAAANRSDVDFYPLESDGDIAQLLADAELLNPGSLAAWRSKIDFLPVSEGSSHELDQGVFSF